MFLPWRIQFLRGGEGGRNKYRWDNIILYILSSFILSDFISHQNILQKKNNSPHIQKYPNHNWLEKESD